MVRLQEEILQAGQNGIVFSAFEDAGFLLSCVAFQLRLFHSAINRSKHNIPFQFLH